MPCLTWSNIPRKFSAFFYTRRHISISFFNFFFSPLSFLSLCLFFAHNETEYAPFLFSDDKAAVYLLSSRDEKNVWSVEWNRNLENYLHRLWHPKYEGGRVRLSCDALIISSPTGLVRENTTQIRSRISTPVLPVRQKLVAKNLPITVREMLAYYCRKYTFK